jgi:hypothetical protein
MGQVGDVWMIFCGITPISVAFAGALYAGLTASQLNTLADCYEALAAFPRCDNAERIHLGRASSYPL